MHNHALSARGWREIEGPHGLQGRNSGPPRGASPRTVFDHIGGPGRRAGRFRARLHADLGSVLRLLAEGAITAQVAGTYPLTEAAAALRHAESGEVIGKIVLVA